MHLLTKPIHFAYRERGSLEASKHFFAKLCPIATVRPIAQFLEVGGGLIKGIFKEDLRRSLKERRLAVPRNIAANKFARHRGHRYTTVIMGLKTVRILAQCKYAAAATPFFIRMPRESDALRAVPMGMFPLSIQPIRPVFAEVDIIHNTYHVAVTVNTAIDQIREDIYRQLSGEQ